MNYFKYFAFICSFSMAGCASSPTSIEIAEQQHELEQQKQQVAQERAQETLDMLPGWVLSLPKSDTEGVYGVGIGESRKLDIAMKKASLNAQYELAKGFNQKLSGSEQNYTQDGQSGTTEQFTQLIDNIVSQVPVQGVEPIEQKAVALDGKYTVYKLVRLSYQQFNQSLKKATAKEKNAEIKAAFAELEERLNQDSLENK